MGSWGHGAVGGVPVRNQTLAEQAAVLRPNE